MVAQIPISQAVRRWYIANIEEMESYFGGSLRFDDEQFTWILIEQFPLPATFYKKETVLLIDTPGENVENFDAYSFFTDMNLHRLDGTQFSHLIDNEGYNPLKNLGYCRLSYHLESFNPSYPIHNGDTIIDICQSIYHFLGQRW